ncbi:hypothetical protein SLE2022_152280 [Rubroshorea leprosula]
MGLAGPKRQSLSRNDGEHHMPNRKKPPHDCSIRENLPHCLPVVAYQGKGFRQAISTITTLRIYFHGGKPIF